MAKIVLRDEKTPTDSRRLTVYAHDGGIRIDGWDYGDTVEEFHGMREYEWMIDVAHDALPALVHALGGAEGDDIFDVIRRTCTDDPNRLQSVITEKRIPHRWWHRVGD